MRFCVVGIVGEELFQDAFDGFGVAAAKGIQQSGSGVVEVKADDVDWVYAKVFGDEKDDAEGWGDFAGFHFAEIGLCDIAAPVSFLA
jgi:hypothetical protein